MLRVLHLIPKLSSGGAERQLVDIVCNTSRVKVEHHVCSIGKDDFFAADIRRCGHEVYILGLDGKYPWIRASRRVSRIVRSIRPHIIHSWLYNGDIVSRLVKLVNRDLRLLTSLQSPAYEPETIVAGNLNAWKVGILRRIDSGLACIADPYFVACSKFVAESAGKWLSVDPSRISVIYNSVDRSSIECHEKEAENLRIELGIDSSSFVFSSVGRLDRGKGFAHFIREFGVVVREIPESVLVIAGDGPMMSQLRTTALEMGIDDRVKLIGRRRDIGAVLEMSDVFVFPTLFEGLGIALIEAMSKGLPCIASRLPVIEEIIDDGKDGLLASPTNEGEFARGMILLARDRELRRKLGTEGRKKVEQVFESSVLMPKWEETYALVAGLDIRT